MATLGFHTIHWSPMFGGAAPVLEVIRLTAEAGFDSIGLDLPSVRASGSVTEVASSVRDSGLSCSDVLVLLAGGDGDLVATARELGALAAATAAAVCIGAVAPDAAWPSLVPAVREAASVLADHGCRLAVEFTPYSGLPALADACRLCDAVGWERCGLVLDSLHVVRSGVALAEVAALEASQIAAVQWDDAPAGPPPSLVDESRRHRRLPGDGGLDLPGLAAAIRSTGWDGTVTAEVLSDELRASDPAAAIPAVLAALRRPAAGWT